MTTHPRWEARPEDARRSSDFSICTVEGAGRSEGDKQHPHPQRGDEGKRKKEKKKKEKESLHNASGFLVGRGMCLLSIRPSPPCTKPTSGCQSILQQTLPNSPAQRHPSGWQHPTGPWLQRAGSTNVRPKSTTRQELLWWRRHLDHDQAPF